MGFVFFLQNLNLGWRANANKIDLTHYGWLANSADPDQTPQNAASDQGLHCLQSVQPLSFRPKIENGLLHYIVWESLFSLEWVKPCSSFTTD